MQDEASEIMLRFAEAAVAVVTNLSNTQQQSASSSSATATPCLGTQDMATVTHRMLHECNSHPADVRVLLIDVWNRDKFTQRHTKSDAILCLESHVILHDRCDFLWISGDWFED